MPGEFDLLDKYADDPALRKETDYILGLFKEIEDGGMAAAANLQKSFSLFDNKSTGTKAMVDDVNTLKLTSANYAKVLAEVAANMETLTDAQKQTLQTINEQFKAEEKLRAGAQETVKLIKTEIQQSEKLDAGRQALAQTIANNAEQIRQEQLERKRLAAVLSAENNSLQKSQAIIDLLINKKKKLNLETAQGARVNEAFNKQIEKEKAFILANADAETKRIKNIGNYEGSAKIIVDALEKARQKVQAVTKEFGQLSPEAAAATRELQGLERITEQPQFLNIAAKVGDTTAEVRFFVKKLNEMEDAGLKNTAVYRDLQGHLAHLTDQLADTRAEVKALASDTRGFDLFASSVSFVASSFEVAGGAAALFGAKQEDIAKVTERLIAIQNVANGVREISRMLTEKGTAANIVYEFVMKRVNIVTREGIATANGLNAAWQLTGIGFALTLLVQFISTLDLFGSATDDAKKETERLTKALGDEKNAIDNLNESIENYSKIQVEKLKQRGATERQIFAEELRTKEDQLNNIIDLESNALKLRAANEEKYQKVLAELRVRGFGSIRHSQLVDEKNQLEENQKAISKGLTDVMQARAKKENEIDLFKEQYKTKVADEGRKKREEAEKKSAEERKRRAEQELKDALDLEKRKSKAVADIVKANIEEEIRQNESIVNSDTASADAKIKAEGEILRRKLALASIEYTESIAAETKIENGKKVIVEKSLEEKLLAQTIYENKSIALQEDTAKKIDDIRKEDVKRAEEEYKKLKQKIYEANATAATNASNISDTRKNLALAALDDDFQRGRIKSTEDFEKRKAEITRKYEREALIDMIAIAEDELGIALTYNDSTVEIEKKLSELKLRLADTDLEKTKDTAAKKLAIEQELSQKKKDLLEAGKNAIISIVDGQFDRQKNQIAALAQLSEDQKNAEIERINATAETAEQKAAEIAAVQAAAAARKEALDKRQKEIDIKKAEFDRIIAVADIVANTAKAVTKDLAGNKSAIPFDLMIGALQLATVLAKPLPKFKDGLFYDYEGWAITGDGGKKEAHLHADGSVSLTPDRDTVTYIEKGDRIFPDGEAFLKAMQAKAIINAANSASKPITTEDYQASMIALIDERMAQSADRIVSAIENKTELHMTASRRSLELMWLHGANSKKWLDEQTNWNKID